MATFTNKATLSFNGGSVDSNTVTGTFLETLSLSKTALTEQYSGGARVTYVLSLVNSGTTAFGGLSLSDDLGGYLLGTDTLYPLTFEEGSLAYFVGGVQQAAPTVISTQPLSLGGLSVPAGGNAVLVYVAEVNGYAPLDTDGSITNTATVSGGGLPEELTASATITTADAASLSITKTLSPTSVPENGTVTYGFLIENRGNTEAVSTDNLVVSDTFDPILAISSVTLDGVLLVEGTDYTYDETTGAFATLPGVITVPAATYTQGSDGLYSIEAGEASLIVVGTV